MRQAVFIQHRIPISDLQTTARSAVGRNRHHQQRLATGFWPAKRPSRRSTNEGKDALYKWRRVGEVALSGLPAQTTAMLPPTPQKPTYPAQPSVKDAAKYAINNNLADFADYAGVKPEVANSCNESLFEHIRDFPELRKNQKFIGTAQAQTRRAYNLAVDRMFQQLRAINPLTITDQQLMAYAKKRVKRVKTSGNTYAQSWE